MRTSTLAAICIGAALLACPAAVAAPGGLDATFDGDGRVTTDLISGYEGFEAVAVQPDGKIVAAGSAMDEENDTFLVLVRYDSDGSLDETFDNDGVRYFNSPYPEDVAIQPDGKILVTGGAPHDLAVARFNDNGSPDMSFSGDGLATADIEGREDHSYALAVQSDGKIVVVGASADPDLGGSDFAVARFDAIGTLDDAFGNHGVQRTNLFGPNDRATGVAIQDDGGIVVAGWTDGRGFETVDFGLARYTAAGSLDTTFSGDGKRRTSFGQADRASAIAIQADGKIVVGGSSCCGPGGWDFAIARHTSNGALDTTFSLDGKKRTDFAGGTDEGSGLAIQANGRILVGGSASPPDRDGDFDFGLVRYRAGGRLDLTFSDDGKQRIHFGSNHTDNGYDLALAPDGKIVMAGWTTLSRAVGYDFGVARFLP